MIVSEKIIFISKILFGYFEGPMNNILRRWHNLQTTWGLLIMKIILNLNSCLLGYVELSYQLASFVAFGTYTIRCEAQQSASEKTFLVDFFCKNISFSKFNEKLNFLFSTVQKKIEVNVSLPFFINVQSPTIHGIVTAKYVFI
jgi:hypothetical protein